MKHHELLWTQTPRMKRGGTIRIDNTAVCSCGRFTSKPGLGQVAAQRAWENHEKAKREGN